MCCGLFDGLKICQYVLKAVTIASHVNDKYAGMATAYPISHEEEHSLRELLKEVESLRDEIAVEAINRLEPFKGHYPEGQFNHSVWNLAHYLAMRRRDLRPLQERLSREGLSSLGRGEPHVMSMLECIIGLLRQALHLPCGSVIDCPAPGFDEAEVTLRDATDALFGARPQSRENRIMVTMPSEAASDYSLVRDLLAEGMNCARINCAHDDKTAWQSMIEHIRRAESELGCECRVLMDLAGHKVRTAALDTAQAVLHIKLPRDVFGRKLGPALVRLCAEGMAEHITGTETKTPSICLPQKMHKRLKAGDRLTLVDTRFKKRYIDVCRQNPDGSWQAEFEGSAYLVPGLVARWMRRVGKQRWKELGKYPINGIPRTEQVIRLYRGDALLLCREMLPGMPAMLDDEGNVVYPARISCTLPGLADALSVGSPVWIDDGKIGCQVEAVNEEGALLRVTHVGPNGARLHADKGINVPQTRLNLPALSDKDREDLDFVCRHADMVGLSFVESLDDMQVLMDEMKNRGTASLPIIAKIETETAVRNLPQILFGSIGLHRVGVMIARGDLSVELGSVRLAEIQEEILWLCEAAHVPVIWATQVLETIVKRGVRSRPEFTDAAMGVRAECVMLNKGPYIRDAVQALSLVLSCMGEHQYKKFSRLRALHW